MRTTGVHLYSWWEIEKKKITIQLSHPFVIRVESKTLRPAITVSLQTGVAFFLNDLIRPPSEFSNSRRHNEDAIKTRTGFRCLRERGQLESSCYGQYYLKNKSKRMGTVIRGLWSLGEDSFNTGPQRDRSLCSFSTYPPNIGAGSPECTVDVHRLVPKERITTALCIQALQKEQYLKITCTSSLSALIKLLVNMSSGIHESSPR